MMMMMMMRMRRLPTLLLTNIWSRCSQKIMTSSKSNSSNKKKKTKKKISVWTTSLVSIWTCTNKCWMVTKTLMTSNTWRICRSCSRHSRIWTNIKAPWIWTNTMAPWMTWTTMARTRLSATTITTMTNTMTSMTMMHRAYFPTITSTNDTASICAIWMNTCIGRVTTRRCTVNMTRVQSCRTTRKFNSCCTMPRNCYTTKGVPTGTLRRRIWTLMRSLQTTRICMRARM
mmetsp:Transcript_40205/g.65981  ORF Transcript_40205/g.65981 Transcript_40205/m.65981 type:complete len:229 (-) Transcript_40205:976-1662(-)